MHEHGGRVDRREAVDEALRRRAAALGLLDRMDDPRQRRMSPAGAVTSNSKVPDLVDSAGEDRVARLPCRPGCSRRSPAPDRWLVSA
jgi:hypothetical protein